VSVSDRHDIPGVNPAEMVQGEQRTLAMVPTLPMSELYEFVKGDPYPSVKRAATAEFMRRLNLIDELLGIETVSWKPD
jgi:hypothetical protein